MEGKLWSRDRILKTSPLRGSYFVGFAVSFILTELGREVYRPYVYQNGINDGGFADVIGNLLGTIAVIFFELGIAHATWLQSLRIIAFVTAGLMGYEAVQGLLPRSIFDWKDFFATPLAGLIALGIVALMHRAAAESAGSHGQE